MPTRALIYQIYPASFGDLKFIAAKIPEIASRLGPNYIWLNPFFLSPWQEGGYDIADYLKIEPRFGTMNDLEALIKVASSHGIGILLDLVLNHTSIEHEWFQKSRHRDPWFSDYYIWMDRPLNWRSFFGGPACTYDAIRGQYYLHLFDKSQPDLNFQNPRVVREFHKIIDFWFDLGVAGFRVDSANVLSEAKLRSGYLPQIPGFFNYYQTKNTVRILDKLLGGSKLFTLAEPVGGGYFSHAKLRELTRSAFNASFNVGTLDIADTVFSDRSRPLPVNYKRWFKKLSKWTIEPKFSFALESHDTPRAPSRFHADPKALAMLQFLLPANYPCIYQGQEIGTKNPQLGNNINDYPGVQSRAIYQKLINQGKTQKSAISIVKQVSRDNARQPLDWGEYNFQASSPDSVLSFYTQLIGMWHHDPILSKGSFRPIRMTKSGLFDFQRSYDKTTYQVHLDMTGQTPSTLKNNSDIIITSR